MTKDVIVTISGLQFAQETETEPVEIVTAGSYYKKNGKHYIIYDEVMEGKHEKYHQADRGFFGCHEKRCDECPYGV